MMERNRIEFKNHRLYYKDIMLNIGTETIQDIYHGNYSEKEIDEFILIDYNNSLRIMREDKLEKLLNGEIKEDRSC